MQIKIIGTREQIDKISPIFAGYNTVIDFVPDGKKIELNAYISDEIMEEFLNNLDIDYIDNMAQQAIKEMLQEIDG